MFPLRSTPSLTGFAACLAASLSLFACTPMNHNADTHDAGLQPLDIPDQGVAKHNPNPRQGYRIRMTIHDAPGPFGIVRGYAQYDVANKDACGQINGMTGTASRMTRLEPFTLTKQSETEYEGVVYADLMQDDDYYGRGVCHWELVMARVALQAGQPSDTAFLPTLDTPDIVAEVSLTTYFWKKRYPSVPGIPNYGSYGGSRDQYQNRADEELFHIVLASEDINR